MSLFPWNADTHSGSHPPATSTGSSSSYQVPQLRWLPSAFQRTSNTLPAISSTLRPRASDPAPAVDSPAPGTPASSGNNDSDSRPDSRGPTQQDAPADDDYSTLSAPGAQQGEDSGTALASFAARAEAAESTPKYGKRLTTKEEVCLFEICNQHAATFGERNKLCDWWQTVTNEFTRQQGHPYSWHSVRRKVEIVSKQRIKFLSEQRANGGQDASNPEWRAVVDAWIPNWERFEEAEAKRIENRDARKGRKRKDRPWKPWEVATDRWRAPTGPSDNQYMAPPMTPTHPHHPGSAQGVRLPPGFDTMFSSRPLLAGIGDAAREGGYYSPYSPVPQDPNVTSAIVETLTKLNKHLDAAASNPRSSPVVSALAASNAEPEAAADRDASADSPDDSAGAPSSSNKLEELKEELREEFRRELEKGRAALEEKLDAVQRTQDLILELLRQEPS
ncbi:hypothetical protein DTO212C5_2465 [Paecilomyces variotii]|nr:hypothetical protein DTO212C5_2465 [Paecilomyces variotii]